MLLKLLQSYGGELGVPASGGSYEVWGSRCTVKLFTAEEAGSLRFPSDYIPLCWGWDLWLEPQMCLRFSYPFCYGDFLIHLMCRSCSASLWVSFRGTCTAERLWYLAEGTFRTPVTLLVSSESVPSWNPTLRWSHLCYFLKGQRVFYERNVKQIFQVEDMEKYYV